MERECSFRYVKTDKPSYARCTLRQSERAHERSHSPEDWCDSQARKYEVQYTVQDREDLLGDASSLEHKAGFSPAMPLVLRDPGPGKPHLLTCRSRLSICPIQVSCTTLYVFRIHLSSIRYTCLTGDFFSSLILKYHPICLQLSLSKITIQPAPHPQANWGCIDYRLELIHADTPCEPLS